MSAVSVGKAGKTAQLDGGPHGDAHQFADHQRMCSLGSPVQPDLLPIAAVIAVEVIANVSRESLQTNLQ